MVLHTTRLKSTLDERVLHKKVWFIIQPVHQIAQHYVIFIKFMFETQLKQLYAVKPILWTLN